MAATRRRPKKKSPQGPTKAAVARRGLKQCGGPATKVDDDSPKLGPEARRRLRTAAAYWEGSLDFVALAGVVLVLHRRHQGPWRAVQKQLEREGHPKSPDRSTQLVDILDALCTVAVEEPSIDDLHRAAIAVLNDYGHHGTIIRLDGSPGEVDALVEALGNDVSEFLEARRFDVGSLAALCLGSLACLDGLPIPARARAEQRALIVGALAKLDHRAGVDRIVETMLNSVGFNIHSTSTARVRAKRRRDKVKKLKTDLATVLRTALASKPSDGALAELCVSTIATAFPDLPNPHFSEDERRQLVLKAIGGAAVRDPRVISNAAVDALAGSGTP